MVSPPDDASSTEANSSESAGDRSTVQCDGGRIETVASNVLRLGSIAIVCVLLCGVLIGVAGVAGASSGNTLEVTNTSLSEDRVALEESVTVDIAVRNVGLENTTVGGTVELINATGETVDSEFVATDTDLRPNEDGIYASTLGDDLEEPGTYTVAVDGKPVETVTVTDRFELVGSTLETPRISEDDRVVVNATFENVVGSNQSVSDINVGLYDADGSRVHGGLDNRHSDIELTPGERATIETGFTVHSDLGTWTGPGTYELRVEGVPIGLVDVGDVDDARKVVSTGVLTPKVALDDRIRVNATFENVVSEEIDLQDISVGLYDNGSRIHGGLDARHSDVELEPGERATVETGFRVSSNFGGGFDEQGTFELRVDGTHAGYVELREPREVVGGSVRTDPVAEDGRLEFDVTFRNAVSAPVNLTDIAHGLYDEDGNRVHGGVNADSRNVELQPGEHETVSAWTRVHSDHFDWTGPGTYELRVEGVPIGLVDVRKPREVVGIDVLNQSVPEDGRLEFDVTFENAVSEAYNLSDIGHGLYDDDGNRVHGGLSNVHADVRLEPGERKTVRVGATIHSDLGTWTGPGTYELRVEGATAETPVTVFDGIGPIDVQADPANVGDDLTLEMTFENAGESTETTDEIDIELVSSTGSSVTSHTVEPSLELDPEEKATVDLVVPAAASEPDRYTVVVDGAAVGTVAVLEGRGPVETISLTDRVAIDDRIHLEVVVQNVDTETLSLSDVQTELYDGDQRVQGSLENTFSDVELEPGETTTITTGHRADSEADGGVDPGTYEFHFEGVPVGVVEIVSEDDARKVVSTDVLTPKVALDDRIRVEATFENTVSEEIDLQDINVGLYDNGSRLHGGLDARHSDVELEPGERATIETGFRVNSDFGSGFDEQGTFELRVDRSHAGYVELREAREAVGGTVRTDPIAEDGRLEFDVTFRNAVSSPVNLTDIAHGLYDEDGNRVHGGLSNVHSDVEVAPGERETVRVGATIHSDLGTWTGPGTYELRVEGTPIGLVEVIPEDDAREVVSSDVLTAQVALDDRVRVEATFENVVSEEIDLRNIDVALYDDGSRLQGGLDGRHSDVELAPGERATVETGFRVSSDFGGGFDEQGTFELRVDGTHAGYVELREPREAVTATVTDEYEEYVAEDGRLEFDVTFRNAVSSPVNLTDIAHGLYDEDGNRVHGGLSNVHSDVEVAPGERETVRVGATIHSDLGTWTGPGTYELRVEGTSAGFVDVYDVVEEGDSIQDAIDDAEAGDTVYVAPGTFEESISVDVADLSVVAVGAEETILEGGETRETAIQVTASDVTIDGFTIRNYTADGFDAAVTVEGGERFELRDSTVANSAEAIDLRGNPHSSVLFGNEIVDNDGKAIEIISGDGHAIVANEIARNADHAISGSQPNAQFTRITDNEIHDNRGGAVLLNRMNDATVAHNNVTSNDGGILVNQRATVSENDLSGNDQTADTLLSGGIRTSHGSEIAWNEIEDVEGIGIETNGGSTVESNLITDAGHTGIDIDFDDVTVRTNVVMGHDVDLQISDGRGHTIEDNFFQTGIEFDEIPADLYENPHDVSGNGVGETSIPLQYVFDADEPTIDPDAGQIILVNVTNAELDGITLSETTTAVHVAHSENVLIDDLTATTVDRGVVVADSDDVTVSGGSFSDIASHAISVDGIDNSDIAIDDNELLGTGIQITQAEGLSVSGNSIEDASRGIVVFAAADATVADNVIEDVFTSVQFGRPSPGGLSTTDGLTFTNNTIIGGDGHGVERGVGSLTGDVTITDNVVTDKAQDGMSFRIEGDAVTVADNTITNTGLTDSPSFDPVGFDLDIEGDTTTVADNDLIANQGDAGFVIDVDVDEGTIASNTIRDNQDGLTVTGNGVYGLENVTISQNIVEDNSGIGLTVGGDQNVVVSENSIVGNDQGLLYTDGLENLDVRENWWGAPDGPSGGETDPETGAVADGSGDSLDTAGSFEDYILFDPWLEAPITDTGTLSGTVTDADTSDPLADATVEVLDGSAIITSAKTDDGGTYELTLAVGTYVVAADTDGYEEALEEGVVIDDDEETIANLTLTPAQDGSIEGTVIDAESGDPIAGAVIEVVEQEEVGEPPAIGGFTTTVETNEDGDFSADVPPGVYEYTVSKAGFDEAGGKDVEVGSGQQVDQGTIELTAFPVVTGTVTDTVTGDPIEGVSIESSATGATEAFDTAETNATGEYVITVPEELAQLEFTSPGYLPKEVFVDGQDIDGAEQVDVELTPEDDLGTVTGTVTRESTGEPVSAVIVEAIDGDDRADVDGTGPDGTYQLQVEPGTYTITAMEEGGAGLPESGTVEDVEVSAGDEKTVNIELEPMDFLPPSDVTVEIDEDESVTDVTEGETITVVGNIINTGDEQIDQEVVFGVFDQEADGYVLYESDPKAVTIEPEETERVSFSVESERDFDNTTAMIASGDPGADEAAAFDMIGLSVSSLDPEPEPELESITLSLSETTLIEGSTTPATVTAIFDDDSTEDVTGDAAFDSSDTRVVSVDGSALTAESSGTATVTATYEGETDSVEVTVEADDQPRPEVAVTNVIGNGEDTDPVTGMPRVYASEDVSVELEVVSDVELEDVTVSVSSLETTYTRTFEAIHQGGDAWTATVTLAVIEDDGRYEVVADATDTNGAVTTADADELLLIDRETPAVSTTLRNASGNGPSLLVESDTPLANVPEIDADVEALLGDFVDGSVELDIGGEQVQPGDTRIFVQPGDTRFFVQPGDTRADDENGDTSVQPGDTRIFAENDKLKITSEDDGTPIAVHPGDTRDGDDEQVQPGDMRLFVQPGDTRIFVQPGDTRLDDNGDTSVQPGDTRIFAENDELNIAGGDDETSVQPGDTRIFVDEDGSLNVGDENDVISVQPGDTRIFVNKDGDIEITDGENTVQPGDTRIFVQPGDTRIFIDDGELKVSREIDETAVQPGDTRIGTGPGDRLFVQPGDTRLEDNGDTSVQPGDTRIFVDEGGELAVSGGNDDTSVQPGDTRIFVQPGDTRLEDNGDTSVQPGDTRIFVQPGDTRREDNGDTSVQPGDTRIFVQPGDTRLEDNGDTSVQPGDTRIFVQPGDTRLAVQPDKPSTYALRNVGTDLAGNDVIDETSISLNPGFTLNDPVIEVGDIGTKVEFTVNAGVDKDKERFTSLLETRANVNLEDGQLGVRFLTGTFDDELNDIDASITMAIDETELPDGASADDVELQYYDDASGSWTVDPITDTAIEYDGNDPFLTSSVTGFSTYGVFIPDTEPPEITAVTPVDGQEIAAGTEVVDIRLEYEDTLSGVNASSVRLEIDGVDRTDHENTSITSSAVEHTLSVEDGTTYDVWLSVADDADNEATHELSFEVDSPSTGSSSGGSGSSTPAPDDDTSTADDDEASVSDDNDGSVADDGKPVSDDDSASDGDEVESDDGSVADDDGDLPIDTDDESAGDDDSDSVPGFGSGIAVLAILLAVAVLSRHSVSRL